MSFLNAAWALTSGGFRIVSDDPGLPDTRNQNMLQQLITVSYLCLSNAMHGQNINLPVCVGVSMCLSVCVSVTLSVNSPTGQTPQRIFTVDSLTDADLCKDVPFGGLDYE